MATWNEFAEASPELAATGRALFERPKFGDGLLATVRGSGLPRINPIAAAIVDGHLLAFIIVESAKLQDLVEDGRYAFHAHLDPAEPNEFEVRGHAHEMTDPAGRSSAAAGWAFEVDDGYRLFELSIESAVYGERPDPDAWPPRYTSWRSAAGASTVVS